MLNKFIALGNDNGLWRVYTTNTLSDLSAATAAKWQARHPPDRV